MASFLTAIISTMHSLPQCLCQNNMTWQYKGFSFIVCLTIVTLILIATFRLHTAGLHQAIVSIYWVELFVPLWLLVTGLSQTLLMVEWVNQTTWLRSLVQQTAEGSVLCLTMPTMLWIETHQPWARVVIHQSLTVTVVQIVRQVNRHYRLMKTCSVRSKHRNQYQSDNREINDKTKPFIRIIHGD